MRVMQFFKDSHGKVILFQWPNIPICGWLFFKLAAMVSSNKTQVTILGNISTTFLLIWAILEITSGVSPFRRVLGLIVLAAITAHYIF